VVMPERMQSNLDASYGLVFSQPVLLSLVQGGKTRDEAYRIVQRNAMQAWDEGLDFRTLLEADDDVDNAVLDDAFDLQRSLANLELVFAQLDTLDVS
nr:adenylosuccinate lyase [Ilumatobacter sp.]